jgi:hypothetical protein
MLKLIKPLFVIFLLIVIICVNTPLCYANSAQPPSVLIIVPNAPSDLEIHIGTIKAGRTNKVNESYFTIYHGIPEKLTIRVTTQGRTFEITSNTLLKNYDNVFTLNLESRTLTPGKSFSRSFTLISLRVILTLLIEAIVFFLFGYRNGKSWLVFLIVNLLTQGMLNWVLNANFTPMSSYIIFPLIGGEILVFMVELAAFSFLIEEHGRLRTALYVLLANLLSLIAGGYLITVLPV